MESNIFCTINIFVLFPNIKQTKKKKKKKKRNKHELSVSNHIDANCCSNIPYSHGTTRNENLHKHIRKVFYHINNISIDLLMALFVPYIINYPIKSQHDFLIRNGTLNSNYNLFLLNEFPKLIIIQFFSY